jgi:hypothetical protein
LGISFNQIIFHQLETSGVNNLTGLQGVSRDLMPQVRVKVIEVANFMEETIQQKVLVVDDSPLAREVVIQMLSDIDVEVITAESGEEALERFQEQEFALILLDVNMGGYLGIRDRVQNTINGPFQQQRAHYFRYRLKHRHHQYFSRIRGRSR